MDETHLINTIKEKCSYISQDFASDLEKSKHARYGEIKYVLPDYSHSQEGYILGEGDAVKEDQQILVLGNERFTIPEVLFTPSDVGTSTLAWQEGFNGVMQVHDREDLRMPLCRLWKPRRRKCGRCYLLILFLLAGIARYLDSTRDCSNKSWSC